MISMGGNSFIITLSSNINVTLSLAVKARIGLLNINSINRVKVSVSLISYRLLLSRGWCAGTPHVNKMPSLQHHQYSKSSLYSTSVLEITGSNWRI